MRSAPTVIYYLPVKKEYVKKWKYYSVDLSMLESTFSNVIVCDSFFSFLAKIFKADFVYCWWWHRSSHVVFLSKLFGVKSFVTGAIHMFDVSGEDDYFKKSIMYRLSVRLSLKFADYNLFISQDQKKQITSHLKVNNPKLLRSTLTKDFKIPESKDIVVNKNKKFITVCWHTKEQYIRKGIFETLDAFKLYKDVDQDFEWVIVGGEGSGFKELESKVNSFGLNNNIKLLKNISNQDLELYLTNSDLYIQPSWHEGFGNAVLEAMSFGLPALVSRYTAQPEVVGYTGLIVLEINAKCIFDELIKFNNFTLDERIKLIDNVILHVKSNFTFSKRLDEFKKIIDNDNNNLTEIG